MTSKREKKRKRKESRELAVKLAKAAAREHIGTPPPTRVKGSRKGGRRRGDKYLQGPEKGEFLNIYEPPEGMPESYISSLRRRPYVSTQPRSYRNIMSNVPVISYSKEMLLHANYLRETKGEKTMNDFLSNQKPSTNTITGPIETALKDAEEKQRYYAQQVSVVQVEAKRWAEIAHGLKGALGLVTGKSISSDNGSGERIKPGKWGNFIVETLTSENKPFTRAEFREQAMSKNPGKSQNTIEVGINTNLKKLLQTGAVVEKDGKFHLPNWSEMTKQEEAA